MAAQCGIDRNLSSFHMARHSFASQICLSQGVPIETVSKAMGHRNISTTQRYAKVTDEKVDRDVTILEHEITGKYTLSGIDQPPSTILKDMSLREMRRRERKRNIKPNGRSVRMRSTFKLLFYINRQKIKKTENAPSWDVSPLTGK